MNPKNLIFPKNPKKTAVFKLIGHLIKNGGVGVAPTDTIYGLVGNAFNKKSVKYLYALKKRNPVKPFIILIKNSLALKKFGINLTNFQKSFISLHWPGKVSIILNCNKKKFTYLHRGTNSLAFRVPQNKAIQTLLAYTGPLVAPSANYENKNPAKNISEAKNYFKNQVDFYLNAGPLISQSSTLVKLKKNAIVILRQGAKKL